MSHKAKLLTKEELRTYNGFETLNDQELDKALEFIHLMSEVIFDILKEE